MLLTRDRGMQYQQNVPALGLTVIVLPVANKKLETMRVLIPKILAALDTSPCRALQPARSAALTMPPA